jgi:hypothetical protein
MNTGYLHRILDEYWMIQDNTIKARPLARPAESSTESRKVMKTTMIRATATCASARPETTEED